MVLENENSEKSNGENLEDSLCKKLNNLKFKSEEPKTIMKLTDEVFKHCLFVGDLRRDVKEKDLITVFSTYGDIIAAKIARDRINGYSLGFASIYYSTEEQATTATIALNLTEIFGKVCRIMPYQTDIEKLKNHEGNIIVQNIHHSVTSRCFYDSFRDFGTILSCVICLDEFGASKGFGFISFENPKVAQEVIKKANGIIFNGKKLIVKKFIPKYERTDAKPVNPDEFTNVFIKNFSETWTDEILREKFEKFGEITSCLVKKDENGINQRFGFCNFSKYEYAKAAVEGMHGSEDEYGNILIVCRHQTKIQRQTLLKSRFEKHKREIQQQTKNRNLFVKNFNQNITEEKLEELFSKFGNITSAKVMKTSDNRSRGFGFVCFEDEEAAAKAREKMHAKIVENRELYVDYAQLKDDRTRMLRSNNYMVTMAPQTEKQNFPQILHTPFSSYQLYQRRNGTYIPHPQNLIHPPNYHQQSILYNYDISKSWGSKNDNIDHKK